MTYLSRVKNRFTQTATLRESAAYLTRGVHACTHVSSYMSANSCAVQINVK